MLNLTHELQEALTAGPSGDAKRAAYLIPDGDALYILQDRLEWLLVLPGASAYIPPHVVRAVETHSAKPYAHALVDWRVWCADVVDEAEWQFRPADGRKFFPVCIEDVMMSGRLSASTCRANIESNSSVIYATEAWDLGHLHAQGLARPLYHDANASGSFNKTAATYGFVFKLGGKILAVPAQPFLAMLALGFQVTCVQESTTSKPPVVGLYKDGDMPQFGFMMPLVDSGIKEDQDGRELFADAAIVSWITPEEALQTLQTATAYLKGVTLWDLVDSKGAQSQTRHISPKEIRMAVSALRWRGLADAQIEELYEAGREVAYGRQMMNALRRADSIASLDLEGKPEWQRAGYRQDVEEIIQEIRHYAAYLGENPNFGRCDEIKQKLRDTA